MARAYAFIANSKQCPAEVQREIAAHNSVHATNLSGKPTVYRAAPKTPAAQSKPAAKPNEKPTT